MKIEDQVCSLEQAKRLKELGISAPCICFYSPMWEGDENLYLDVRREADSLAHQFAAYTVAELGVMLPRNYASKLNTADDGVCYSQWEKGKIPNMYGTTEAQARAAMLIYLLENKLITADQVNQSLKQ